MNEKRILIVEDDLEIAKEIKEKLQSLGYQVVGIVNAGNETVGKVEDTRPDLVLMDIMMRGKMEGPLLAAVIRSRFNIPVVYLSGLSDKKILEWANMKESAQTVPYEIDEKDLFTTIELAFFKQHIEKKLNFENLQNLPVDSQEKRFWMIVENAGDAMFVVNPESFLYINKAFEKMTGYSKEEICTNGFNVKSFIPDPRISLIPDKKRDAKQKNGEKICSEFMIITREGDEKYVEASIRRIDDLGDKTAVGILRDITERKKKEENQQDKVHKLQDALENIIDLMVSVAEMKDPYTVGHQKRVSHLACAIAEEMGLSEDRIEGIRLAASIHDIGKLIQVPPETLKKEGDLADVEFSMIKMHPQIGYDLLKTIEFPYPIAKIILQHHERIDGTGYPMGIQGGEILPEARILAVADVVEAMASPRSFRPASSIEKALEEITRNKGELYDSDAVDACLKLFKEKKYQFPLSKQKSKMVPIVDVTPEETKAEMSEVEMPEKEPLDKEQEPLEQEPEVEPLDKGPEPLEQESEMELLDKELEQEPFEQEPEPLDKESEPEAIDEESGPEPFEQESGPEPFEQELGPEPSEPESPKGTADSSD
ncbi:MAG: PAS domain S-box protein [Candidatus Aminicenantes bacterium]|nr:PAS domain S-box protein [Candidatus Aminicenantes bacterium]